MDFHCLLEITINTINSLHFYNIINVHISSNWLSWCIILHDKLELISLVIIEVRCKEYMYMNIANNNTFILLTRSHTQQTLLHVFACVNVTNVSKLYTVFWISIVEWLQRITSHTCLLLLLFFFFLSTGDIVYDLIQHLPWDCFFL